MTTKAATYLIESIECLEQALAFYTIWMVNFVATVGVQSLGGAEAGTATGTGGHGLKGSECGSSMSRVSLYIRGSIEDFDLIAYSTLKGAWSDHKLLQKGLWALLL